MPENQNNNETSQSGTPKPQSRQDTQSDIATVREKNLDKTIADSFPSSDPPSTIPNPNGPA